LSILLCPYHFPKPPVNVSSEKTISQILASSSSNTSTRTSPTKPTISSPLSLPLYPNTTTHPPYLHPTIKAQLPQQLITQTRPIQPKMGCTPSKFSRARDKRGRREPSRSTLSPSSKKHDINDNGTSRRWEDSNPFSAGYEARRKGREKGGQGWSGRQGRKGGSRNVKGR